MTIDVSGWSCDERNRKACRNPHGCHCREITALRAMTEIRKAVAFQEGAKYQRREILEGPPNARPAPRS
jgi:hypothetical protein